jgi:hypothetical protein
MTIMVFKYNDKQKNLNHQLFKYITIYQPAINFLREGQTLKHYE